MKFPAPAQDGDRRAFATLVEQYWGKIYGWLYRLTRNRHVAEDVTQETFLKALRAIASFKAGTYFRAWLFRIAHNSRLSQCRRGLPAPQTAADDVPARPEGPAEHAMNREALAHLAGVVAAHTWLPVLGVPIESKALKGMDSLLSTVQMPAGIPVGTLAIGSAGAKNAALLAAAILALSDEKIRTALQKFREQQTQDALAVSLP